MQRRLIIIRGDVTLLPLPNGAIVNPSNTGMILTSRGVNQQISRRAGPYIQQTMHICRSKLRGGRLEPGHAISTEAGQLQVDKLIHVAIVGARKINKRLISRCLLNAYDMADELKIQRIGIPPLGPIISKFPMEDFFEIFWRITSEEFVNLESLEEIYLALDDEESFQAASAYAEEHIDEMPESIGVEISEEGINLGMFTSQFSGT